MAGLQVGLRVRMRLQGYVRVYEWVTIERHIIITLRCRLSASVLIIVLAILATYSDRGRGVASRVHFPHTLDYSLVLLQALQHFLQVGEYVVIGLAAPLPHGIVPLLGLPNVGVHEWENIGFIALSAECFIRVEARHVKGF